MESEEEVIKRHKKEQRDLVSQQTSLRKQATKSTRKRINRQIQELEDALKIRQSNELKALTGEIEITDELTPEELLAQMEIKGEETANIANIEQKVSDNVVEEKKKRNRQKERLAKRQAQFELLQQEASLEASNQIDYRAIELRQVEELCLKNQLKQIDIKSDGHCLFNALSDQLKYRMGIDIGYLELRKIAGKYIENNPDDFIPFLFDEETGALKDIASYIEKLTNTAMWGSDLEILALSKVYDCSISVYQANQKPMIINPQGQNNELKLIYYKHIFGLGEHYGSLQDL